MLSCYAVAILLIAVVSYGCLQNAELNLTVSLSQLWLYFIYLNKKKEKQLEAHDAQIAAGGSEQLLEAWHDLTDIENPHFKYSY